MSGEKPTQRVETSYRNPDWTADRFRNKRKDLYKRLLTSQVKSRLEKLKGQERVCNLDETQLKTGNTLSKLLKKGFNGNEDMMKLALHHLANTKDLNVDLIPKGHFLEIKDNKLSIYSKDAEGNKTFWMKWEDVSVVPEEGVDGTEREDKKAASEEPVEVPIPEREGDNAEPTDAPAPEEAPAPEDEPTPALEEAPYDQWIKDLEKQPSWTKKEALDSKYAIRTGSEEITPAEGYDWAHPDSEDNWKLVPIENTENDNSAAAPATPAAAPEKADNKEAPAEPAPAQQASPDKADPQMMYSNIDLLVNTEIGTEDLYSKLVSYEAQLDKNDAQGKTYLIVIQNKILDIADNDLLLFDNDTDPNKLNAWTTYLTSWKTTLEDKAFIDETSEARAKDIISQISNLLDPPSDTGVQ